MAASGVVAALKPWALCFAEASILRCRKHRAVSAEDYEAALTVKELEAVLEKRLADVRAKSLREAASSGSSNDQLEQDAQQLARDLVEVRDDAVARLLSLGEAPSIWSEVKTDLSLVASNSASKVEASKPPEQSEPEVKPIMVWSECRQEVEMEAEDITPPSDDDQENLMGSHELNLADGDTTEEEQDEAMESLTSLPSDKSAVSSLLKAIELSASTREQATSSQQASNQQPAVSSQKPAASSQQPTTAYLPSVLPHLKQVGLGTGTPTPSPVATPSPRKNLKSLSSGKNAEDQSGPSSSALGQPSTKSKARLEREKEAAMLARRTGRVEAVDRQARRNAIRAAAKSAAAARKASGTGGPVLSSTAAIAPGGEGLVSAVLEDATKNASKHTPNAVPHLEEAVSRARLDEAEATQRLSALAVQEAAEKTERLEKMAAELEAARKKAEAERRAKAKKDGGESSDSEQMGPFIQGGGRGIVKKEEPQSDSDDDVLMKVPSSGLGECKSLSDEWKAITKLSATVHKRVKDEEARVKEETDLQELSGIGVNPELVERRVGILTKVIEQRTPTPQELSEIIHAPEVKIAMSLHHNGKTEESSAMLARYKEILEDIKVAITMHKHGQKEEAQVVLKKHREELAKMRSTTVPIASLLVEDLEVDSHGLGAASKRGGTVADVLKSIAANKPTTSPVEFDEWSTQKGGNSAHASSGRFELWSPPKGNNSARIDFSPVGSEASSPLKSFRGSPVAPVHQEEEPAGAARVWLPFSVLRAGEGLRAALAGDNGAKFASLCERNPNMFYEICGEASTSVPIEQRLHIAACLNPGAPLADMQRGIDDLVTFVESACAFVGASIGMKEDEVWKALSEVQVDKYGDALFGPAREGPLGVTGKAAPSAPPRGLSPALGATGKAAPHQGLAPPPPPPEPSVEASGAWPWQTDVTTPQMSEVWTPRPPSLSTQEVSEAWMPQGLAPPPPPLSTQEVSEVWTPPPPPLSQQEVSEVWTPPDQPMPPASAATGMNPGASGGAFDAFLNSMGMLTNQGLGVSSVSSFQMQQLAEQASRHLAASYSIQANRAWQPPPPPQPQMSPQAWVPPVPQSPPPSQPSWSSFEEQGRGAEEHRQPRLAGPSAEQDQRYHAPSETQLSRREDEATEKHRERIFRQQQLQREREADLADSNARRQMEEQKAEERRKFATQAWLQSDLKPTRGVLCGAGKVAGANDDASAGGMMRVKQEMRSRSRSRGRRRR